jgi:hypothetical protein
MLKWKGVRHPFPSSCPVGTWTPQRRRSEVNAGNLQLLAFVPGRHDGKRPRAGVDDRDLSVEVLVADAATFMSAPVVTGAWRLGESLPLSLCDVALVVAAGACWTRNALLVELTYFWGLTGTLQAVVTPDLSSAFPHLQFFEYVVGHVTIVVAALYLVIGLNLAPRRRTVPRGLPSPRATPCWWGCSTPPLALTTCSSRRGHATGHC